jgi:hypothetical protein
VTPDQETELLTTLNRIAKILETIAEQIENPVSGGFNSFLYEIANHLEEIKDKLETKPG